MTREPRFNSTQMCRICGYQPDGTLTSRPTSEVFRYWDADDGWIIGHLCPWCYDDAKDARPKPGDYAYADTNHICDVEDTDEDVLAAL